MQPKLFDRNIAVIEGPRASSHVQSRTEHELVDMGKVAATLADSLRNAGSRGPAKQVARVKTQRGVCGLWVCRVYAMELPKRSQLRCLACNDGTGAYYHLQCFFSCHRCLCLME